MLTTATTWGITGPQFLWGYGALCAGAAIGAWQQWRAALGPKERGNDPLPDLGLYKLAMLGGGPQLAITTAATKLHRDSVLTAQDGELRLVGELGAGADRLERAVADTIGHEPGITAAAMRAELADGEPIRWMKDELTSTGLLVDDASARRVRRLWLAGAALTLFGIARILAVGTNDAPAAALIVLVVVVTLTTVHLSRLRALATNRGRAILKRHREENEERRRSPVAAESVLMAALFGGGALWLADPAIASSLGVPREDEWRWGNGGSGAGGGGCAASGCGGGGGGGGGGCGGGGGGGGCGGGGGGGGGCGGGGS